MTRLRELQHNLAGADPGSSSDTGADPGGNSDAGDDPGSSSNPSIGFRPMRGPKAHAPGWNPPELPPLPPPLFTAGSGPTGRRAQLGQPLLCMWCALPRADSHDRTTRS